VPHRRAVFAQGEYYHICNRGAARGRLFFKPANYEHCLRLLKRYRSRYGATVIAYCLMPNHYHLLLRQETDTPLSRLINTVFNAYVQAVNIQENRSGALFEGRFRHACVEKERYLVHVCRYIHLNPVRAKLVRRAEEWPYSNYLEWIGRRGGTLCDETFIRKWFGDGEAYQRFVADEADELRMRDQVSRYFWD